MLLEASANPYFLIDSTIVGAHRRAAYHNGGPGEALGHPWAD